MASEERRRITGDALALFSAAIETADAESELPSEILDGFLFLGSKVNSCSLAQLTQLRISHILNVSQTKEFGIHPGITTKFFYAADDSKEDICKYFKPGCDFIESAERAGGKVLVHCMAGKSRSSTLVLAYLMRVRRMTLHDAFGLVRERRKIALPNLNFWMQLSQEEREQGLGPSQPPPIYARILAERSENSEITSSKLFKRYALDTTSNDAAEEQRTLAVEAWLEGWPGPAAVREVLECSLEGLRSSDRRVAVHFLSDLVAAGRLQRAEAMEGIQLLLTMDEEMREDLRMDNPKIDDHLEEIDSAAGVLGLVEDEAPGDVARAC